MSKKKTQRNITLWGIITALVLIAGIWWFFVHEAPVLSEMINNEDGALWGNVAYEVVMNKNTDPNIASPVESMQDPQDITLDWNTFTHPTHSFTFKYPPDFTVGQFAEGESGESIVVQNISKHQGFQIYISPIDEDIVFTKDRIRKDIPDMTVDDPQVVNLGDSSKGIAFFSKNKSFGRSREVWFTFNGHLYQISTYASLDNLLQLVFSTWAFN